VTDPFKSHATALTSPARKGFSVTPNDSADLSVTCRALFVGSAGDVSVILADDSSSVVFKNVPAGTVMPISVKRVEATLTTATDILGLY
jgi:hypothetical protein